VRARRKRRQLDLLPNANMADTFEDETQQPSFHVTAPSTHSSSQVPPSSQSSHPMPKSTPVPESLYTLPLFVANQIQLGGGPQANGGARSPSDPQLEQAADVATELQSETRDVVGSLPRKQSPTWATAPLDPQQQQDHVESPPRHTSASPVPTEEDELDPESFSIERQHVEEEPPNIPSPANTDTPPHSPTRRPASPPAASQSKSDMSRCRSYPLRLSTQADKNSPAAYAPSAIFPRQTRDSRSSHERRRLIPCTLSRRARTALRSHQS
jgi:hypothetical protein